MPAPTFVPQLLTYDQAAERLAVCKRQVQRLVDRGAIPFVQIGSSVRIPAAALAAYIVANTRVGLAVAVSQSLRSGDIRPIGTMHNTGWQEARKRAKLPHVRVHDLKHTFGRRLRAAGVSFEDRQDLLGHRSGRITTHYSAPELANLIDAANKVCDAGSRKTPALVILKKQAPAAVAASA